MRFSDQQLTLWYGTPDAPAPVDNAVEARRGVAVTVAVQPASLSNTVSVWYRIDDRLMQTIRAVRSKTDFPRNIDYFRATFPTFWSGERVTYLPVLTCAGRTVPDPTTTTFSSSFRLGGEPPGAERNSTDEPKHPAIWAPPIERLPFSMDYLASVHVPLKSPEVIGVGP